MAKAKELRKRIKSVKNTKKITKTMEMVAASKLKRALDRVVSSRPYMSKLVELLNDLTKGGATGLEQQFPLLDQREPVKKVLVFAVTTNRGLCGSYNANVIRRTRILLDEQKQLGREVEFHIAGRKGLQFFRFRKYNIAQSYTDLAERPTTADAERFSAIFTEAFLSRRVDRVYVVFGHFKSALQQPPTVVNLLPIEPGGAAVFTADSKPKAAGEGEAKAAWRNDFILAPNPETILGTLFPLYLRSVVYRIFLESATSEQSARRIAMKNATDSASDMITNLTRSLNKARQSAITQELAEIVSGAAALQ